MVKNSAAARFASIAKALNGHDGVAVGSGKRGFGSDALQVNGKIFAMLRGDSLVLKLSSQRVGELVGSGVGTPFDAGKGRPMKEWIVLEPEVSGRWLRLSTEALAFVSGSRAL